MIRCSLWPCVLGLCLLMSAHALAQPSSKEAKPKSKPESTKKEEPIDFDKARELLRKEGRGEKLTAEEQDYLERAKKAHRERNQAQPGGGSGPTPRETTGLKPLTEMSAEDRYKGEDGGLYGQGRNSPPEEHRKAAEAMLKQVQPLDRDGKPDSSGRIVFISISMSNATQEFSKFKEIADEDPAKSTKLTIVDCAQGGRAMAQWSTPEAPPWEEANRRIQRAGVTPDQVQVAWIKLANPGPRGDLAEHGKSLQKDTQNVIQIAKTKFPNLRIAYLSSRIYAGYASTMLNPEPYAYESAFAARWLIQDQMRGESALNYAASKGPVRAPLLLWGPYLWADGTTPRKADKLTYLRDDLGQDGTHPSQAGREKVARAMLEFYKTDPLAKSWFVR